MRPGVPADRRSDNYASPTQSKGDPGQSYELIADVGNRRGSIDVVVHEGGPRVLGNAWSNQAGSGRRAELQSVPFCKYVHSHAEHSRIREAGQAADAMLVVADIDSEESRQALPRSRQRSSVRPPVRRKLRSRSVSHSQLAFPQCRTSKHSVSTGARDGIRGMAIEPSVTSATHAKLSPSSHLAAVHRTHVSEDLVRQSSAKHS